jgi:FkbM family methyltransferase
MMTLQSFVQTARKVVPRGWSPIIRSMSSVHPRGRLYPAALNNGDTLYVDLAENMCHIYFFHGGLPHERYSEAFFGTFIKRGDVVLDIGANVGYFTRLMSTLVGEGGRVHAFEPSPSALRLLRENVRRLENVQLHELAVSDTRGTSSFSIQEHGDTSSLGDDPGSNKVIRVQTDTLDNILGAAGRIDLIKIDVEGYEYEVLRGALQIIREQQPLVYFEYIERYGTDRGLTLDSFRSLLAPLGYSLGWISSDYPESALLSDKASSYLIAAPAGNRWNISF